MRTFVGRKVVWFGVVLLAGVAVGAEARDILAGANAGRVVIRGDGAKRALDCRGGQVAIVGNHNRLTAHHCSEVDVRGNRNEVTAEFAAAGHLEVSGEGNRVSWHAPAGVRVRVGKVGANDVVTRY